MTMTTNASQCHVDFITELPFDILPLILRHFKTQELFHLLTVSKTWKMILVNTPPSLWSSIIFRKTHLNKQTIKSGLAPVVHHVKRHDMIHVPYSPLVRDLLEYMKQGMFVKLESLELVGRFLHSRSTKYNTSPECCCKYIDLSQN
ncbi:hypothetical protein BDA99DRAFT_254429 [Phascolomyces articulosus]|uniref:F-box domain-containing protein n=1 Tax=Phascolomyces articulosus TaxID=60185 RepID=A0AAD5K1W1_9FUNG|nr:hypothetical protein BDA99DRAFT_254429 [Phascolomyces articulosus]